MFRKLFILVIPALLMVSCSRDEKTIGSLKNPMVMGISKSYYEHLSPNDLTMLETKISNDLKINFKIKTFDDSVRFIESIGNKDVDVAFLTLNEYLIAREEFKVFPVLQVLRGKGENKYYGIIASLNNDIKNLKDIDGKKFAARNEYSIASFVLPSILFFKGNIKPEFVFSGSYDDSYNMLKNGKADAAGFYKTFLNDHKDLNVIYEIGPIPNEPVICRKSLDTELCNSVKKELMNLVSDDEYVKIINSMADITGFSEADISEYKEIHQTILNNSNGIYSLVPDGIKIRKLLEDYNFN
ncbi:MAG: phosphate/phosphite/phosphonate ABC transporter substrate-binding protein [Elusimicrobia bacterium]|nr:phosphate/phosphite/phosphonate ABC transporter substrate-binding protein [Elusimicrobiota bacterium]